MSECISCVQPLEGEALTLPWEDGDNVFACITFPHCGSENIMEGFGEDEA